MHIHSYTWAVHVWGLSYALQPSSKELTSLSDRRDTQYNESKNTSSLTTVSWPACHNAHNAGYHAHVLVSVLTESPFSQNELPSFTLYRGRIDVFEDVNWTPCMNTRHRLTLNDCTLQEQVFSKLFSISAWLHCRVVQSCDFIYFFSFLR